MTAAVAWFTDVQRGIWDILVAEPRFSELIHEANRIRVCDEGGPPDPIDDNVTTADYPKVTVVPVAAPVNRAPTFIHRSVSKVFAIRAETDDPKTLTIDRIDEAILRAIWKGRNRMLNRSHVHNFQLIDQQTNELVREGKRGWASTTLVEVAMQFTQASL